MQQPPGGFVPNIFSGMTQAPTFEKGVYFQPGIYDCIVSRVQFKETRESGDATIVELEVVSSRPSGQINPHTNAPYIPDPVGTKRSWYQSMGSKDEQQKKTQTAIMGQGAVKQFIYAVLGAGQSDPKSAPMRAQIDDVIEDLSSLAVSASNTLGGLYVHLEARIGITEKKKQEFTYHDFFPIDFAAMGAPHLAPPSERLIAQAAQNKAARMAAMSHQVAGPQYGAPPGYGQPLTGYGLPPQPSPGQWGSPPPQPSPGQGWGAPPPNQGPPPGYGQPPPQGPPAWQQPPQGPPAQNWGPPPPQAGSGPGNWGPQAPQGPPPGPGPLDQWGRPLR